MSEYIEHDGSSTCPEKARGLDEIQCVTVNGHTFVDTVRSISDWSVIARWKRKPFKLQTVAELMKIEPAVGVQATLNERGKTHGDFKAQAETAQQLKSLVMGPYANGVALTTYQTEALETICMKISRILHGNPNEPDHWRDIAGYATLVENILVHGKSHLG